MNLNMADAKPGVMNFLLIGLMALVFIVLGKWLFNRYPVPGVTTLFNAA